MSEFEKLHPSLKETLITGLGWNSLREVQESTYKAVSQGSDVIVIAPTAGGKTESAFIPVIDGLLKNPDGEGNSVRAIYISPLKALINDQIDRVYQMCVRSGLSAAVQHGDVQQKDRWKFIGETCDMPDILLTTPESLEVLMSGYKTKNIFSKLSYIVIDEIHAFMESDRGVHLKCLMDRLDRISKNHITRIGLSATVGNPDELLLWMSSKQRKKQLIRIKSKPSKKQFSFIVNPDFETQADEIAKIARGKKVLVFADSRSFAEKLITPLRKLLPSVYIHHSSVSAEDRKSAELSFEQDFGTCVICTSTMELGIDIGELDMVIQYGAPASIASFLQRLGRTGRRGKPASMTFILKNYCELLTAVSVIEAASRGESENLCAPACPYHVLIQQMFLFIREKRGAVGLKEIIDYMRSLTPFEDVPLSVYSEILEYLIHNNYLISSGNMYLFGEKAERELGRSNWLALYSVIHDSGGYLAVLPDGTVVGKLDPKFIGSEAGKRFTFTGRTWRLIHRDDIHKRALVEPASQTKDMKKPFWTGSGGAENITELVCQSVMKTISCGKSFLPLQKNQNDEINSIISRLPNDFEPGKIHIRCEPESKGYSVAVSAFLGPKLNMVLARLIKKRLSKRHTIRYTQFAIRIFDFESKDADEDIYEILREISRMSIEEITEELPKLPQTTWKFGELLPDDIRAEMAAKDYYKIPELQEILQRSGLF